MSFRKKIGFFLINFDLNEKRDGRHKISGIKKSSRSWIFLFSMGD